MIIYDDDGIGHDVVPRKVIEDIKNEIQTDIDNVTNNSIYSRYDIDDGILIGLQMALDTVNKHIQERSRTNDKRRSNIYP